MTFLAYAKEKLQNVNFKVFKSFLCTSLTVVIIHDEVL